MNDILDSGRSKLKLKAHNSLVNIQLFLRKIVLVDRTVSPADRAAHFDISFAGSGAVLGALRGDDENAHRLAGSALFDAEIWRTTIGRAAVLELVRIVARLGPSRVFCRTEHVVRGIVLLINNYFNLYT